MPIYEYACPKCGEFEHMQRITDDPLKKCPTCGGKVRKLISNSSFQLKGSGWYVTDYGGKKGEAKKSGEAKEASAPDAAGGGTESKPKEAASTAKKDTAASAA